MGQRIAISINSSWNFVNFRKGLVRELGKAGFEVVAIAPPDEFIDEVRAMVAEFVPLAMRSRRVSPLADLALLRRYRTILKRIRPAAYLGFTIKPNTFGSLAAHSLGIPVINNIAGLGKAYQSAGLLQGLASALYRLSLRKSRTIFFQNQEDMDLFVRNGIARAQQARLLPGSGVDLSAFQVPERAPGQDGEFRFLLLARLLWEKGLREYVEAARIVRAQRPDVRFQLLGLFQDEPGAPQPATVAAWQDDGLIEFLGGARDVRPHIAESDCVVLPTFYPEGTPRSLLEAAAMGRPLIASDVPGCRATVEPGRNGYLVPPRNGAALAAAMLDMIGRTPGEIAAFGAASRAKAEAEFDERLIAQRYLEALAGLG